LVSIALNIHGRVPSVIAHTLLTIPCGMHTMMVYQTLVTHGLINLEVGPSQRKFLLFTVDLLFLGLFISLTCMNVTNDKQQHSIKQYNDKGPGCNIDVDVNYYPDGSSRNSTAPVMLIRRKQ